VLDADKEGFLRSERSLIQTIGRAARNLHGKAILYADRSTGSIEAAMQETERRRGKQIAHNEFHGITPMGIQKAVQDIMEGAYNVGPGAPRRAARVAEPDSPYASLPPEKLLRTIKQLEQRMYKHAQDLEFEEAARLRDEIQSVRDRWAGLGELKTG
jgi:excinuclease ABC subunit B